MPRGLATQLNVLAGIVAAVGVGMLVLPGYWTFGWWLIGAGVLLALLPAGMAIPRRQRRTSAEQPPDAELRRLLGLLLDEFYADDCRHPMKRGADYREAERFAGQAFDEIAKQKLDGSLATLRQRLRDFRGALELRRTTGRDVASGPLSMACSKLQEACEDFLYTDSTAAERSFAAHPCATNDLSVSAVEILSGIDSPGQLEVHSPSGGAKMLFRTIPSGRTFVKAGESAYLAALAALRRKGLLIGTEGGPHSLTARGGAVRRRNATGSKR